MYGIICSPHFFKEIEQAISSKGEQILFQNTGHDIDILLEFEKINRLPLKHLIIDITSVLDDHDLIQFIKRYRIMQNDTQVIIIAPNCRPGNVLLHTLVTMGVYDIIAPFEENIEDIIILPPLIDILDNPSPYKKAVRWVIDESNPINRDRDAINDRGKRDRESYKEREVVITKEKIIGTVIIAIAGTMNRIGTTHTCIALAEFLKNQNYKVAVVEFHQSRDFQCISNAYEDVQMGKNYFILDNIHFYAYTSDINMLDVLREDFNYIILDLGLYNKCNIEEFKRSNVRIILSGVKDWELTELELILREGDSIYKNLYLFNFADKGTFSMVKANMDGLKCFKSPYSPNPFSSDKDCYIAYKTLLQDVLPITNKENTLKDFNVFESITKKLTSLFQKESSNEA